MVKCTKCGAELKDGVKFCTECGTPLSEEKKEQIPETENVQQPAQQNTVHKEEKDQQRQTQPQQTTFYAQPVHEPLPKDTKPASDSKYALITPKGYIGIMFLLGIPVIGFFLMIVWACGGCRKKQKTNFARAMLIITVISLILAVAIGFAVKKAVDVLVDNVKEQITETVDDEDGSANPLMGFFGDLFEKEGIKIDFSQLIKGEDSE